MAVYKRSNSPYYSYDFELRGVRYRGSTKEKVKSRAEGTEANVHREVLDHGVLVKKSPVLSDYAKIFLHRVERNQTLKPKTKKYYENGVRRLAQTNLSRLLLDQITTGDIDRTVFPGGPSNAMNAIRTLRKMLNEARDEQRLSRLPKIHGRKEQGRDVFMDDDYEAAILPHLSRNAADVVILSRDCGLRNHVEACSMRWEYVSWDTGKYRVHLSKSDAGQRTVELTERPKAILKRRHLEAGMPQEGWVFPSAKTKSGHLESINNVFRLARQKAGLPDKLTPYGCRHDFGSTAMAETGDVKLVGQLMGHRSVSTTMKYLHVRQSQTDKLRAIMDARKPVESKPAPARKSTGRFTGSFGSDVTVPTVIN